MTTTEIDRETITAAMQRRDLQRTANNGWLLKPPINPAMFANARMEQNTPGSTHAYPNHEMVLFKQYLSDVFDAGGNRRDLAKVWNLLQPLYRQHKAWVQDHYENLCRQIDVREQRWSEAMGEEGRLDRNVSLARARVQGLERQETDLVRELTLIRSEIETRRAELMKAVAELKASTNGTR